MQILFAAPFLIAGCVAFLLCTAIPKLRRFTLSTALWCVACGPCLVVVLIVFLLVAKGLSAVNGSLFHSSFLDQFDFNRRGTIFIYCVGALGAIAAATAITFIHGWILKRVTLNLFRLYLSGVTVGVGILTAIMLGIAVGITVPSLKPVYLLFLLILPGPLALFVYRHADEFRGNRPELLNPISAEEYG